MKTESVGHHADTSIIVLCDGGIGHYADRQFDFVDLVLTILK
jgi:hypothetical protein